jgi:hypothetical protein
MRHHWTRSSVAYLASRLAVVEHPGVPFPHGPRGVRCHHPRPPRRHFPSFRHRSKVNFRQILQLLRNGSVPKGREPPRSTGRARITMRTGIHRGTNRRFAGPLQRRVINGGGRNGRHLQGPPQSGRLISSQLVQGRVGPPGLDPPRTIQVGLAVPAQVQANACRGQGRKVGHAVASAAIVRYGGGAGIGTTGSASRTNVVDAVSCNDGRRNRNCGPSSHFGGSKIRRAVDAIDCSIVFGSCRGGAKPCHVDCGALTKTSATLICDFRWCILKASPAQKHPRIFIAWRTPSNPQAFPPSRIQPKALPFVAGNECHGERAAPRLFHSLSRSRQEKEQNYDVGDSRT